MAHTERLQLIADYIAKNAYASINNLAEKFEISTSTVRRYLIRLSEQNIVELVPGGAVIHGYKARSTIFEEPFAKKRELNLEEKRRIGKAASQLIPPQSNIFLYSSSTVAEMVEHLPDSKDLMVTTNDVMIASALSGAQSLSVLVVGGILRNGYYTTMGMFGDNMVSNLRFDLAFLGIDAISPDCGITITNAEEASIKRTVIKSAKKVVALCDHSKFGKVSFVKVCDIGCIDTIITGKELSGDIAAEYEEAGIHMIQV